MKMRWTSILKWEKKEKKMRAKAKERKRKGHLKNKNNRKLSLMNFEINIM